MGLVVTSPLTSHAQTEQKALGDFASFEGNVGYYATGNTMGRPSSDIDGLACLLRSNTATVPAENVGPRAQVLKAYLYYSGVIYRYESGGQPPDLTKIDREIALQFPGRTTPQRFTPEKVYRAQFSDNLLNPGETSYFYTARVDITDALKANGTVAGTYTFSEFNTPVCPQPPEALCDDTAMSPSCANPPYYAATASFFMTIVYTDPAQPPRAIKLFDGLEAFESAAQARTLSLQNIRVSAIPRGQITFYGIEGDARQTGDSADISANGRASVLLGRDIQPPPGPPMSSTCGDASWPNWNNNLFDSSTVLDPTTPTMGACTRGIDIDTFDVSPVLQANDSRVDVTVRTTGTDKFGIAFAALSIDVFRPVLDVDSRKQVLFRTQTTVQPKTSIVYRIGISNTGNIPATGVSVTDDMPLGVSNLKMLRTPPSSTDASSASGGLSRTGKVDVRNITVNPGDIFEVRYQVDVTCPVPDGFRLINQAAISDSAEGAKGATLFAPTLRVIDPNADICEGRKQPGEEETVTGEIPDIFKQRKLFGGAGCTTTDAPLLPASIAIAVLLLKRRRKGILVLSAMLLVPHCTCRKFVPPPADGTTTTPTGDPTAPPPGKPTAAESEPAPPGTPCAGNGDMVQLSNGVCIDRYESVIEGGAARVKFGEPPTSNVSYTAASAACVAAGKRLCTGAEWELACRGTALTLYPYGDQFVAKKCNGFDAEWNELWEAGAGVECKSDFGAYDLSGNLSEWVNTDFPFTRDGAIVSGKQVRGSSFIGNASGLTCTALIGADPNANDPHAGVRCCK
jgi:uncharacterized repeat protein (TIGR01451 family)